MPGRRLRVVIPLALALGPCVIPGPATAQFRWRGEPLPDCRWFLLTESGLYLGTEFAVQGDVGLMANVSPHSAVGASAHGMIGGDSESEWGAAGIAVRCRYWLSRHWSVDLSPRLQWTRDEYEPSWGGPTFGATAAIGVGDLVGLAVMVDEYHDIGMTFALGVRLGSYLGAPGLVVAGGLAAGQTHDWD